MLDLIPKLPMYWSFRTFGWPQVKPFSVVISVSYACNSKCRTCDVWRKPNDDLSVEEWDKVFASLGNSPFYLTFTGGEPFLRKDLDDLVQRLQPLQARGDYHPHQRYADGAHVDQSGAYVSRVPHGQHRH